MPRWFSGAGSVLVAAFFALHPAQAQKSADTVRIPFTDPIATASLYYDSKGETALTSLATFDTLTCYDRVAGQFVPLLASAWRQVDDRTIEFTLRDDVTFHDGSSFGADDVVATFNWIADPAAKIRFGLINFPWLARAEKVDAHTVRIVAKEPTPLAMLSLAVHGEILSARLLAGSEDKAELLRKNPVGTGPYRITALDAASGVTLERNAAFRSLNSCKQAAQIGKVRIIPMPDAQTQMAQLTVGGVDWRITAGKDEAEMLTANPDLVATAVADSYLQFLAIDSIGRSGVPALSDVRVRQAIGHALNGAFMARNVMPGGDVNHDAEALCTREQLGCDYSTKRPDYDLAAAKALLAAAGYADGFDVGIVAMPGSWEMADAIAGELRKIGIRASVEKATQGTMRERQAQGKFPLFAGFWPPVYHLDASALVAYLFDDTPRNYWKDPLLKSLGDQGVTTVDPTQRKAVYRQLFDRVNDMSYVVPLAVTPSVIVHARNLFVEGKPRHPVGSMFYDLHWN